MCAALPHAVHAQAPSPGVFTEVQTAIAPHPSPALEPATVRSRVVQVDTQKITAARRGREVLKLNLFDDATVEVEIKRVRPTRTGYFISGSPRGKEWGEVRLVVNGPVMVGTVETPGSKYTIRSAGSGRHVIRETDPAKTPFECGVLVAPSPDPSSLPAISSIQPSNARAIVPPAVRVEDMPTEDGSEVRLLLVYTPKVQANQGGIAGMRALIDLLIASANQAFEDSGISPRLVLAHSAMVDYAGDEPRIDLDRLRDPHDGYMDEVHALRNQYAADLVHLLTDAPTRIRGIAYLLSSETLTYEDNAFALSAEDSEEVFTHEIGHNFGVAHDRYVHGGLPTVYPYAHGYVNEKAFESDAATDALWHTVMAYDDRCEDEGLSCERLLRFSNPDQSHAGDPLGVSPDNPATGLDGPADARLTVNNTARWVGSLRSEACTGSVSTPESVVAPVDGGEIAFRVEAGHGCVWEASTETDFLELISGAYFAGSSILRVQVEANRSGSERNGTLTVAGNTITVRQLEVDKGICARTSTIVFAIMEQIGRFDGSETCDVATSEELARVRELFMYREGITSLKLGDFDGLSGLTVLNMETNSIRELPDGIFDDLTSLTHLIIGGNELSELPEGILDNLTRLTDIDLENMNLVTLPERAFSNLVNLERLQLNVNDIAYLPAGLLAGLSRLRDLDIHGNAITELPEDFFADLSSLEILNLGVNRLEGLPEGAFAGLSRLEQLDLYANRIPDLPAGLFGGLTSLKELHLDQNRLTELPAGLFAGLSNLEELGLRSNRLTALPPGLFSGLSNLKSLALSFNRIAAIPDSLFAGLANLNSLDLYGNALVDLAPNQFSGLSALKTLFIGGNLLSSLHADLFADLPDLNHLSLTGNRLSGLPEGIFSGLANLDNLRLGDNAIDPLPLRISLERVGEEQFKAVIPAGAPFSLVLPVSANNAGVIEGDTSEVTIAAGALESLPVEVARAPDRLDSVSVDFGRMPSLPPDHAGYELIVDESLPRLIFTSIDPEDAMLTALELSEGELAPEFSADTRRYTTVVANGTSKLTVSATTNNTNATVELLDANDVTLEDADPLAAGQQVQLLVGQNTVNVRVTSDDGTIMETYELVVTRDGEADGCVRSERIRQAILDNTPGVGNCSDLTLEHLSSIRKLDLSNQEISLLNKRDFSGLDALSELNLTDNALRSLPSGIFSDLSGLTRLWLANNSLSELEAGVFSDLTKLQSLRLGGNQLLELPPGVFAGLSELRELNISRNDLRDLPSGLFEGLTSLEGLYLFDNELIVLSAGQFSGLTNLRQLQLSDNSLLALPADVLSGLASLRELHLGENLLTDLPAGIFSDLGEVQTLSLSRNELRQIRSGVFSDLDSLNYLSLDRNAISSLPMGLFSGLGSLEFLLLSRNRLSDLPDGIFSGLGMLGNLDLSDNARDPLPLAVSLEKAGEGQFRAVAPSGAPFDLEVGVRVSETGMITGDVAAVTISTGATESSPVEVVRVEGTEAAVTVDITDLPDLPKQHKGYFPQKDETLPRTILPGPEAPPPAQVMGVEVAAGAGWLDVSWTAVSDATGYKVQWKSGEDGYSEERQALIGNIDTPSHRITGLTPGTEYTLRVIATREHEDDGLPSAEVTGTPVAEAAGRVGDVRVAAGVEQLEVTWNEIADADGYKVQWKTGDEDYGESRQAILTGGDTVSHTITALTPGTEYTVRVIATRAYADDGEPSEEVTGTPKASPPAQVTGLTAESGLEELVVSWDAVSDASGYKVQWKSGTEDYAEARQVALLGGQTTSYTIIDLTADTEYTVRVIATKENADDGAPSEEVTATPLSADPDVNGDGTLDGNDALIMYNSYASEDRVGDGETGGTAESRQTLLAGYSGKTDPTDGELKEMIRKSLAWRDVGVDVGGDINEDGEIDEEDAFVMYYAYATANLVGNGTTGGTARFRQLLLAAFANKENPTDEDLKAMLRRANKLREDFG